MDKFAGQMNLCDFGSFMERCPGSPECTGPAGTRYEPTRLFDWDQWISREFVKESLIKLFPEKCDEISEKIDVGEYGLEDYWCRLIACFIFSLSMMQELLNLTRTISLLYHLPTKSETWITYNGPMPGDRGHRITHRSDIHLRIAGMSLAWKIFNCCFILLPKAIILKLTIQCGTTFLMETAGIENVVINCVALSFLLSIDEMIYEYLNDRPTKAIMEELDDFARHEELQEIKHDDEQEKFHLIFHWSVYFPTRLCLLGLITFLAVWDYYSRHCVLRDGGSWFGGWISQAEFIPQAGQSGIANALMPSLFPLHYDGPAYWNSTVVNQKQC